MICRCGGCPRASEARCRRAASGREQRGWRGSARGCVPCAAQNDVGSGPRSWEIRSDSRQVLCCWPWQHRIRKRGIFTRRYDCGLFLFLRVNCYCVSLLIADCHSVPCSDVVSPTLHAPNNAALPWAPWTIATLLGTSDGPLPGSARRGRMSIEGLLWVLFLCDL